MVTFISLFAGCGGSSLGYKWAGFKELLAVEWDKNAVETFRLNFPEVPVWQRDICSVTGKEILKFCKINKGELSLLDGSPPCQGFSTAGKRIVSDARNDLFKEYSRLLKELQPKVFVMENVSGMIKGIMKGKFLEILAELKSCGYQVKCKLMNAMWYEVPQSRERLIFIGVRNDLKKEIVFPEPMKEFISVKEALKNVKITNDFTTPQSYIQWAIKLKPGENIGKIHPKGFGFNMTKLNNSKPAPTITKTHTAAVGLLHPTENRFCSIPELMRIASYPDNFKFSKGSTDKNSRDIAWARIGNSVPPKMMYHIAKTIKEKILDIGNADKETGKPSSKGTSLKTARKDAEIQA